jgi:hypothetical protein
MFGHYASVSAAANAQTLLTIGADMDCVEGGHCVMGVATVPNKVEVVVNSTAAAAVGAAFKSAFRMMIR